MKFFTTVSLEKACEDIMIRNKIILKNEKIKLENSVGRILAEDIISSVNIPSFDRSVVDGYAVDVRDTFGASESVPVPLFLSGEILMGEHTKLSIGRGNCVYVPTGGMLPAGADGVVMIEDCEKLDSEILISRGISNFSNMVLTGDEIKFGEKILNAGEKITPYHIGVLASIGQEYVSVIEKIKFAIISTGDEIIPLGTPRNIGEVYDINTYTLSSLIEDAKGEVVIRSLVGDKMNLLHESLESALEAAHVVLISGGSSVGVKDFTEKAIESIGGEIFLHGIAVKPGKPTIGAICNGKFIFGLPGHPQSAINIFRCLVEPSILKKNKKSIIAKLGENLYGDPGKVCFINVKIVDEGGEKIVYPIFGKSSMVRPLLESCGYIAIPDFIEGYYAGEMVEVVLHG
ncbi:MAG: molybdopterin molybdotransferase MoeA [Cetobacterium sp.]|uniref:molybdopterin molybdotransferase MoeA n=1 Tax=Cetobacterium sp. TaxID=2071632 RepID=UPI002FCA2BDF